MIRRRDWLVLVCFLVVAPMSLGGCGGDGDSGTGPDDEFQIPAAWRGVWETTTVTKDCEGNVLDTDTDLEDLCEGETVSFEEDGQEIACTGSGNDTSFDLTCTSSFTFDDCTATITADFSGTRNGDTYIATVHTVTTSSPSDCFGGFCQDFEITGTRISDTPDCSSSAPSFLQGAVAKAIERAQLQ
jgi:hypothetical protein